MNINTYESYTNNVSYNMMHHIFCKTADFIYN